jgi:ribosome biogenesis protein SSF1/2
MAKRRTKKRTHVKANVASGGPGKPGGTNRSPKSMVIRMGAGEVGPSITQLTKDVRAMMEPETASRLKVYRSDGIQNKPELLTPMPRNAKRTS